MSHDGETPIYRPGRSLLRLAGALPALLVLLAAATPSARAFEGIALESGTGLADLQTATTMPAEEAAFGLSWDRSQYFIDVDPQDNIWRLGVTAGIVSGAEAAVSLPYVRLHDERDARSGVGDASLLLKYRLNDPGNPFGLAIKGGLVILPLGDADEGLGNGRHEFVGGFVASHRIGEGMVTGQVDYRFIPADDDRLLYGVGFVVPANGWMKFFGEYVGESTLHAHMGDNDGEVNAGFRWDLGRHFQVTAGAGKGFYGDTRRGNDWRLFAAVTAFPSGIPGKAAAPPPVIPAPPPPAPPVALPPAAAPPEPAPARAAPPVEPPPPPAEPAPALAPPLPPPPPAELPKLPVEVINFEYDHMLMTPEAEAVADAVAEYLNANPTARVIIEGHCDSRGTASYNEGLGMRRAKAVGYRMIFDRGIAPDRIAFASRGEMQPAASNETDQGKADNRRVVIILRK